MSFRVARKPEYHSQIKVEKAAHCIKIALRQSIVVRLSFVLKPVIGAPVPTVPPLAGIVAVKSLAIEFDGAERLSALNEAEVAVPVDVVGNLFGAAPC